MFNWRQWIKIGEWGSGLLGLSKTGDGRSRGLIMIQIDGLAKSELQKAFDRGDMPFLKSLQHKENYRLHNLYPGLPSTTPAVQGELFYGVKQIVPAFFFFDRQSRQVFRMFDGDAAREIERRLADRGQSLLEGGSSYSNIFTGGAQESHFCAVSLGWAHLRKDINPWKFVIFIVMQFLAFLRITILCIWEVLLAVGDFVYGLWKREDVITEFNFVFLRVALCILMRELIVLGVSMDTARGLPVIHLNLIGYDEQAHRRGPDSGCARWALKGIDKAIARIFGAASRSHRRHYDVWVYSDHGQEPTIPYVGHYGRNVEQAVDDVFKRLFPDQESSQSAESLRDPKSIGEQLQRVRYLGGWIEKIRPPHQKNQAAFDSRLITTAMGPVGGVYVFQALSRDEKVLFAKELVASANIPLILMPEEEGRARAWTDKGEFLLPQQAGDILGRDHPYFEDVVRDLIELSHHANAGTLTIFGWRSGAKPFSFPFENGAHAGPGLRETDAFALLPSDAVGISAERPYLKIMDLRQAAFDALKGINYPQANVKRTIKTIRIMTYNVHSCVGMDGKTSPERIARVIARHQPDIVALQEVDIGRKHTGRMDQPHLIAKQLEMMYHFYPSIRVEEARYGNAILSRFPMDIVRVAQLPKLNNRLSPEPRGAMSVSVVVDGVCLQIVNAHLSYYGPECLLQAQALTAPEWIGSPSKEHPVILCGDFNCFPDSRPWRAIQERLQDAQRVFGGRPLPTWFSRYPVGRIDHVFVGSGIKISSVNVPETQMAKTASDHLPLIVDLEII